MIIEEVFNYRHWAETTRLYTGWLEKEDQRKFIKSLAKDNILLAAECRANLFFEDLNIDNYLAKIAVKNTKDISKTKMTANGLLALAVLDKYDKILRIFESKKTHQNDFFYIDIISAFITNASEYQIIEFLKILSSSNIILFGKALDIILENSIIFAQDSKKIGQLLLLNFDNEKNYYLKLKVICLFHLTHLLDDPKVDLYKLIAVRLWNYAIRLSGLFVIIIEIDILSIINQLIDNKKTTDLKFLLKILERSKLNFDETLINIEVSKSLNPIIKKLALVNINSDIITEQLAIKICQVNIEIGNLSSIQFADEVINQFHLEMHFNKSDIVIRLLKSHKYQSIKLAYQLIKKYSLYNVFNYRIVLDCLVGNITSESLIFSRQLILEEFPIYEQEDLLTYICILSFKDEKLSKIRKQILLNDLNQFQVKNVNRHKFNGLVINGYKGQHQIYLGNDIPYFYIPYAQMRLKKYHFYKFILEGNSNSLSELEIKLDVKHPIYDKADIVWFGEYYIGQILDISICSITLKSACGITKSSKNQKFIIPISEIDNNFIKDITKHIEVNKTYKVRIKSFNKNSNQLICSLKDLKFEGQAQLNDKLSLLKEKYKKH